MPMTPEQESAIRAALTADLASLESERLIELCLLYRAQPTAVDTFPDALEAEITRRFTADALAADDTLYSVLTHFANQFQSAIPRFHLALLEMAATVNRDIWFADHEALFRSAIDNEDLARWLTLPAQNDILNKVLRNRIALGYLAQSTVVSTAVLTEETAVALWKDAPDLWDIWPNHQAGMTVLAKSAELTRYITDTPQALAAVANSATAMSAVANSATAMSAVAASAAALAAIVGSDTAKTAIMTENTTLQSVRDTLHQTVSAAGAGWVKQRSQHADAVTTINATMSSPNGLVFACLGFYSGKPTARSHLHHPDGSTAATAGSRANPTTLATVDGVSFNGATFTETGDGFAYAELWTPQNP